MLKENKEEKNHEKQKLTFINLKKNEEGECNC